MGNGGNFGYITLKTQGFLVDSRLSFGVVKTFLLFLICRYVKRRTKEEKMKKVLLVLMALVAIGIAGEMEMFLVQDSLEGYFDCPNSEQKLLEVEFNLDKPALLLITQSLCYVYGSTQPKLGWLVVNGEKLIFSVSSFSPTYMMSMDSGKVTVQSWVQGCSAPSVLKVKNPILQVMVFYPSDEPSVTEAPPESSDGLSSHSILSSGPFVHVQGCSEVYDIAGNKVDCEISNGDVYLNQLSAGTYFATGSNGRTTKIVKLK